MTRIAPEGTTSYMGVVWAGLLHTSLTSKKLHLTSLAGWLV